MNGAIEYKDLAKHFLAISGSNNLKNISVGQMESIALLMEMSYRKGKSESNEGKKYIRNCTVNVKVDCDVDEFKEKVNKALSDVFEDLSKTISTGISY